MCICIYLHKHTYAIAYEHATHVKAAARQLKWKRMKMLLNTYQSTRAHTYIPIHTYAHIREKLYTYTYVCIYHLYIIQYISELASKYDGNRRRADAG